MKRLAWLLVFSFIFLAGSAHAQERAEPERFSLSTDFLGYFSGRFGLQGEYRFARRDSVSLYGFAMFDHSAGDSAFLSTDPTYTYSTSTKAFGLDAQYRHWVGPWSGLKGFFFAPGLEFQHFDASTTQGCGTAYEYNSGAPCPASLPNALAGNVFTSGGLSFDVGAQAVIGGLVIGGSIGAHYRVALAGDADGAHPWSWDAANGMGLRPRARFWMGWAF